MKKSNERILTTHVGSLPRPHALLDIMAKRFKGESYDEQEYDRQIRNAVVEMVDQQIEAGLDVITDGEMSKPGHAIYINQRLAGFEARPDFDEGRFPKERSAFPEYYDDYFKRSIFGGMIAPSDPLFCVGPIQYTGREALQADIDNLKAATEGKGCAEVFMPSATPTGVGYNEYYPSQEEYLSALADALNEEYRMITDAGFLLQVDDPFLPDIFMDESLSEEEKQNKAGLLVEIINQSLKGVPPEKVRFHICYGINAGPRVYEPDLPGMIDNVLKVNATGYSFEAGNPRHEHEYHLWENVKLPEGKLILPGVITHASTVVEHPEYIAERIIRFAERVGRENVIASADCGFSSQAMYNTEIDPKVMWAKFRALAEGAKIASKQLWR